MNAGPGSCLHRADCASKAREAAFFIKSASSCGMLPEEKGPPDSVAGRKTHWAPGADAEAPHAGAEEAIRAILEDLASQPEEETEPLWALVGFTAGLTLSLAILFHMGKVAGLSGPGINSGLSALGSLGGGGMLAGLCLLLAHAAAWSVAAYFFARRRNRRHAARAAAIAMAELCKLQETLLGQKGNEAHVRFIALLTDCMRLNGAGGMRPAGGFFSPK